MPGDECWMTPVVDMTRARGLMRDDLVNLFTKATAVLGRGFELCFEFCMQNE